MKRVWFLMLVCVTILSCTACDKTCFSKKTEPPVLPDTTHGVIEIHSALVEVVAGWASKPDGEVVFEMKEPQQFSGYRVTCGQNGIIVFSDSADVSLPSSSCFMRIHEVWDYFMNTTLSPTLEGNVWKYDFLPTLNAKVTISEDGHNICFTLSNLEAELTLAD